MDAETENPQLAAILANLSREIRRPLDSLQQGLSRFLDEPGRTMSDVERNQAQTMLTLCEDLGLLTRERLGDPPADRP